MDLVHIIMDAANKLFKPQLDTLTEIKQLQDEVAKLKEQQSLIQNMISQKEAIIHGLQVATEIKVDDTRVKIDINDKKPQPIDIPKLPEHTKSIVLQKQIEQTKPIIPQKQIEDKKIEPSKIPIPPPRTKISDVDDKAICSKCHKVFNKKTLSKRNGICGHCYNKCTMCGKQTNPSLLNTNRVCKHCVSGVVEQKSVNDVEKGVLTRNRKAMGIAVWNKYIGDDKRTGPCYVCGTEIRIESFHQGHVIAEAKGGQRTLENLRPTCQLCNTSCGSENLDKFKEAFVSKKQ